jgi:hypothetical protein
LRDGTPFLRVNFVRSFLLPVLYEVLNQQLETVRLPIGRLGRLEVGVSGAVVGGFLVAPFGIWGNRC